MKKPINNAPPDLRKNKPISLRQQQGVVIVFTAISLILIFGMAGLAVDLGHAYANRTRIKNILDATALSAARELHNTKSITEAEAEGRRTFTLAIGTDANKELSDSGMAAGNLEFYYEDNLTRSWSNWQKTADWLANETETPSFVTAVYRHAAFPTWFMGVLGAFGHNNLDRFRISEAATAAPIPIVNCNNFPLMMCAENGDHDCEYDKFGQPVNTDDEGWDNQCFGYPIFEGVCIKEGTEDGVCTNSAGEEMTPTSSFHFLEVDGSCSADDQREVLAGAPFACVANDIPICGGNRVGPLQQGFNTRFGPAQGGLDGDQYQPDHIVAELPLVGDNFTNTFGSVDVANDPFLSNYGSIDFQNSGFLQYLYMYQNHESFTDYYKEPENSLRDNRRVVAVPVADCSGFTNSTESLPRVGFACMFLNKEADGNGTSQFVFTEIHGDCTGKGEISSQEETTAVDFVLYKTPYQP